MLKSKEKQPMSEAIERKLEAITEMLDDGWEVMTKSDVRNLLERELKPLLEAAFELSRELESPIRDVGMIKVRREQLRAALVCAALAPAQAGKEQAR